MCQIAISLLELLNEYCSSLASQKSDHSIPLKTFVKVIYIKIGHGLFPYLSNYSMQISSEPYQNMKVQKPL